MYGTSSESQRNVDCNRVIFIFIWGWPKVKIRGQSSNIGLTFKPFVPPKNKCHHEIPHALLPQRTKFHISGVWPGVKTPGQRSDFLENSETSFWVSNQEQHQIFRVILPHFVNCDTYVSPGSEVKAQSYLHNNHRGRDSFVASKLENRLAHPQVSYINRKAKIVDGHRLIFILNWPWPRVKTRGQSSNH